MRSSLRRRLAASLALLLLSPLASAAHLEIEGGRSYMDSHGTNAAFIEGSFNEYQIGNSRFSWAPDASLGWINGRNEAKYAHSNYTTHDDVWLLAGGARFRFGNRDDWYHGLFFSEQIAAQKGRTMALSSVGEFVSTLGWQSGPVSLQIRHISNGGVHGPNRGETMGLVGVGFDF